MPFDPKKSKIAIAVPQFTLKRSSEGAFGGVYNEPYLVSLAIDAQGQANPEINFNFMPFPKVRPGETISMLGDGHLLYGPKNPGEFVALTILAMESDRDMRKAGGQIDKIVSSSAVDLGLKALIAANPGAQGILAILKELTQLVAGALKNNKDDELFRTEGTFLRDHPVPYHVNRLYEKQNDYVSMQVQVIALEAGNGQGSQPRALIL